MSTITRKFVDEQQYFEWVQKANEMIVNSPAPWTIGELDGEYYGTRIFDADGMCPFKIWFPYGPPSQRQKGTMSDKQWKEYCCDGHWESQLSLEIANVIIVLRNLMRMSGIREDLVDTLRGLIGIFDSDGVL